MENFTRASFLRCMTHIKICSLKNIRNISNGKSTSLQNVLEEDFEHFPDKLRLKRQKNEILQEEKTQNNLLLDELLDECGITQSSFQLHGIEKEFILTIDTKILKKMGLLKNDTNIHDKLLCYLKPFNYSLGKEFSVNYKIETIKKIRDFIEKEYLAWRFQVDVKTVGFIMRCLSSNLFIGRSISSIKNKLDVINILPSVKDENVLNKIYVLNVKPFSLDVLKDFENSLLGYSWVDAFRLFPQLCSKPYPIIMLYLNILQKKKFSKKQNQEALPYLKFNLMSLLMRLNYLLSSTELSSYCRDDQFLRLLYYRRADLKKLVELDSTSYEELQSIISSNKDTMLGKTTTSKICYELIKSLKLSKENIQNLKRHPKHLMASETQIGDTLNYLREQNFSEEEIIESITIVLYPRENIIKALNKISEEKNFLERLGFVDGCVSEGNCFSHGTKLKKKTLQLCLYYMEIDHGFSGNGIFYYDD